MRKLLFAAVSVVPLLTACFAAPEDLGASSPSSPSVELTAFPSERTTGLPVPQVDCGARGARMEPSTMADAKQRLLGVWVRCSDPVPAWAPGSPIGAQYLEIRDGSWHQLEVAPDGTLHRRVDLGGSGEVRFVDTAPMNGGAFKLQADFEGGGGWFLTQPRFEASPERLQLVVYPGDPFDYMRAR